MEQNNNNNKEINTLFPIFLKLSELNTLVVGGGYVGLEKLQALLKNDPHARITVVGTTISKEIKTLFANNGNICLTERPFQPDDLNDKDIVILATNVRDINQEIKELCKARRILTNVADTPDLCDFYLGSTVTKGQLKIGISTNGKSPTFAKRFRQLLEEILPEEINDLLSNLSKLRDKLKGDFEYKVKTLNDHTASLISDDPDKNSQ